MSHERRRKRVSEAAHPSISAAFRGRSGGVGVPYGRPTLFTAATALGCSVATAQTRITSKRGVGRKANVDWCVEHAPQHPTCQSKAVRPVALSDPPPPSFVGSSQNRAALSLDSEKSSRVPCQVSVESARSRSWVSDR
eukprot:CAMPEP_0174349100 /NCGR_PEP_ID=MMETSP0811_2-20130205/5768_1 /TAXON_ID=73025 ORGANISM="Eutreptiella gymnastica-like, Strain CCMP1594" /NCGR_SAMPLE_ID=MMETSP0811_2 /ASSEMBLY_ACC=CAM_ASM_000667 /LENGTH=137 /DNA_ID=CAMNT_0015476227 /DNA_START=92 /DNA_END=502 /DNA_ORIENTATION=-